MPGKLGFSLVDTQTAQGVLDLVDTVGVHGAGTDAPPTWAAEPDTLTLTPAADGLSCIAKIGSGATAGDVIVTATCIGAGVTFPVSAPLTIEAGPAAGGSMIFVPNASTTAPEATAEVCEETEVQQPKSAPGELPT